MRVPVRRLPETRVSERQQGYARPVQPLDVSPIVELAEGFRDQMLDEQDARQRVELNSRLLQEVNELQSDFETRRRNPEISPIDFADNTNAAYTERHAALLAELRREGYSQDLLDDLSGRLGTVRQTLFERGLGHQLTQLRARAGEQIEDVGRQASQYATTTPDGYATARDTLVESIRSHPDLMEDERAAAEDQQLAILRDGASGALAIQNPQFVIDTLDPQGLTAPHRTAAPSAPGTTPTAYTPNPGADRVMNYVAREHGFQSVPESVQTLGQASDFATRVNRAGASSSAMGLYQITGDTLRDFAPRVFGTNWRNEAFTPAAQEQIAEAIFNSARGSAAALKGRWASLTTAEAERVRQLPWAQARVEIMRGESGGSVSSAPVQTASVQTIDLPPSQTRQQSDATIAPANIAEAPGLRVPGNIDLTARPIVQNADGTVSTVRTISIGTDRGEVLIPTVINGQVVSEEAATEHYRATGEHLGIFDTPENATAYAQQLHDEQARAAGAPTDISSIRTGNALIDDLNGPERLRLLGLAREQLNRVTATARAEMDVRIGNIVAERMNGDAGTPLPSEQEVLQLYGPIEGPQRFAQIQAAEAARPAIIAFRTQSATDIQRALDVLEPDPGSPTYATELPIYQAAERAAQALLTEREQDPAAYAMRHFPSVQEAAGRGTQHYYAELDRVYETLGIDARHAPVMPTQAVERLTEDYRTMTPSQRREFMRTNMAQMGEDRFRRFVADMEGTTAESDARIFELLRTYPGRAGEVGNVYQQILEGREIIAQDPARRPRSEQMLALTRQHLLPAIGHLHTRTSQAIQEAVEGLYAQRNGDPVNINVRLYREALATVLGGNLPADMRRGAVQDHTILPPRTNERQFQGWIEQQTVESLTRSSVGRRAPRYGDLRTPVPMQDIIDEGVFVMVAPGQYMIYMGGDGRPLGTSNTQPFIVNVDPREVVRAPVVRRQTPFGAVM